MKKRGRVASLLLAGLVLVSGLTSCGAKQTGGAEESGSVKVGIAQFAEHKSLDNCRLGFIEGLKQEGYEEGKNITFYYENAQADGNMANQIVDNLIAKKADLICGIATPMAQAVYASARKTELPVIYSAVTDPVKAQLASEDKGSVGEVTGTSDKLPVEKQLEMIKQLTPEVKKIGILYSTSEVNSISAIEEFQKAAPAYGVEIVTKGVASVADVPLAVDGILTEVDCLNNVIDNTIVSALPTILQKANKVGIPVYGSEIEQVKIGCLASVGLDYYELGIQTGKMAASVLKGKKKASEIPYVEISEAELYVNKKVAENLNITLSDELLNSAKEVFEEITQ